MELKRVVFKGIHFDRCTIRELRLQDSTIDDCVFTACDLEEFGVWRTTFEHTRLCDVDLRRSSLGAVDDSGGHNTFRDVEFVRVDLRENGMAAAEMKECRFADCNLRRVNFGGTRFERCTFSGLLDEVQFYAHEFGYEHLPRNEMKDISFADARFRYVEFRKLDMNDVVWPTAPDHVIVQNYRATLACIAKRLDALGTKPGSLASKRMTFLLRWAGDHQNRRVAEGEVSASGRVGAHHASARAVRTAKLGSSRTQVDMTKVWERLAAGGDLDGLGLPKLDGRWHVPN